MGQMKCQTQWIGEMGFESHLRGHKVPMDAKSDAIDLAERGPTPKELLLASICGCSGMDVVSILKKMRVELLSCSVNAQTETTENYPSVFSEVKLQFHIRSPRIQPEQALKAVTLSMTKYCGVSAMVVQASPITYEVFVNEEKVGEGQSDFTGVGS